MFNARYVGYVGQSGYVYRAVVSGSLVERIISAAVAQVLVYPVAEGLTRNILLAQKVGLVDGLLSLEDNLLYIAHFIFHGFAVLLEYRNCL